MVYPSIRPRKRLLQLTVDLLWWCTITSGGSCVWPNRTVPATEEIYQGGVRGWGMFGLVHHSLLL